MPFEFICTSPVNPRETKQSSRYLPCKSKPPQSSLQLYRTAVFLCLQTTSEHNEKMQVEIIDSGDLLFVISFFPLSQNTEMSIKSLREIYMQFTFMVKKVGEIYFFTWLTSRFERDCVKWNNHKLLICSSFSFYYSVKRTEKTQMQYWLISKLCHQISIQLNVQGFSHYN